MGRTFVIAEAGSCHDNKMQSAYRLIDAAKECDADACKFQFWSSSKALATRRGIPEAEPKYEAYRMYQSNLEMLKNHCDQVGIEFMVTVYIPEDIGTIAPLVRRFKVSAFESKWSGEFTPYAQYEKPIIASTNGGHSLHTLDKVKWLHCISNYPTEMEDLNLNKMRHDCEYSGLSDHTANVLTGAAAVAAGASIIEAHIKLEDTPADNPDFPHSLDHSEFEEYVRNIRTVERML
jgi:sialic acid synthase SpsE